MSALTSSRECALCHQILQVPCRRRAERLRDGDVILGAQTALEAIDTFAKHPGDRLLLPFVELAPMPLVKSGLGDGKFDACKRDALGFEDRVREIDKPVRDFRTFVAGLQAVVIGLAVPLDRVGERNQARLAKILSQRLFGKGASDPPVAVLKWMDALEIKVGDTGPREGGKRRLAFGRCVVEPGNESIRLGFSHEPKEGLQNALLAGPTGWR